MKMKKIISMGLAAIMAVSAMSISAFAVDSKTTVANDYDFFTTKQILTYNPLTNDFDSTYVSVPSEPNILKLSPSYSFTFNQTVSESGDFLVNTAPVGLGSDLYLIGDDNQLTIKLKNKPSQVLYFNLCYPNGTMLSSPKGTITTQKTTLILSPLYSLFGNIGGLKIMVSTPEEDEQISGAITEY